MATPHNQAAKGDFAKTVLMPGDPLRAKFIAENFLTDAQQVTGVRGMLGYTGLWKGKPVSVMGSGMGMPSIGIYSWELFSEYGVENIIRVGSAGSLVEHARVFDVVLATAAKSDSSYAKVQGGFEGDTIQPSEVLCGKLRGAAAALNIPVIEGALYSSDVFYKSEPAGTAPAWWEVRRDEWGCVAVEMESFALFHNARMLGKNAACLVTISDSFVSPEITTPEQRQTSFTAMMKIALDAAVE